MPLQIRVIQTNARRSDLDKTGPHAWANRRAAYTDLLRRFKGDIICAQELRSKPLAGDSESAAAYVSRKLNMTALTAPGSNLVTLVRKDWTVTDFDALLLPSGENQAPDYLTLASITTDHGRFRVANLHVDAADASLRQRQWWAIPQHLDELDRVVLCGDFNALPDGISEFRDGHDFGVYLEHPDAANCHHWTGQESARIHTDRIMIKPSDGRIVWTKQKLTTTSDHNIIVALVELS